MEPRSLHLWGRRWGGVRDPAPGVLSHLVKKRAGWQSRSSTANAWHFLGEEAAPGSEERGERRNDAVAFLGTAVSSVQALRRGWGAFKLKSGPFHPGVGSAPHTSHGCWRPALGRDLEPLEHFCATRPRSASLSLSVRPGKKSSHFRHSLSIFLCQAWGQVAAGRNNCCQVSPSREGAVHPFCGWRKEDSKRCLLMLYSPSVLLSGICLHPGS